jgi:addiction module antitoxin, RelB/DinJ family
MAQVNLRIDDNLKAQGEMLFEALGLSMSDAVSVFISQAVREGGIPFALTTRTAHVPNAETLAAMQEIEDMRNGKFPKPPQSLENLFKELGIDVDG